MLTVTSLWQTVLFAVANAREPFKAKSVMTSCVCRAMCSASVADIRPSRCGYCCCVMCGVNATDSGLILGGVIFPGAGLARSAAHSKRSESCVGYSKAIQRLVVEYSGNFIFLLLLLQSARQSFVAPARRHRPTRQQLIGLGRR